MNISKFLTLLVGVLLAVAFATPAQAVGSFEPFASHPSITSHPASGQGIKDMAIHNGELYLGYGDYNNNTGPINIATINLTTGSTDVKATATTEEINTYRSYNGKLYAPWIDPQGAGGLYSSNSSGSWTHAGTNVNNVHIYDVAVLPNGVQVAVGSAYAADGTFGGATAFVSRDGGSTWKVEMTDLTAPKDTTVSGYERYYWVAVVGGKAYMQAVDSGFAYGQVIFPLRVFDGSKWTSVNKSADCFSGEASNVEVFNRKMYCNSGRVFDGRKVTTRGGVSATDFFQSNGSFYALSHGNIKQLSNGSWVTVAVAPAGATSIAVTDTHVYAAVAGGQVMRATR